MDVIIPVMIGFPPISRTIGPKMATVAALLSKFVSIQVKTTDTNPIIIF